MGSIKQITYSANKHEPFANCLKIKLLCQILMPLHWLNRNNVELILFDCNGFWMTLKSQVISYPLLSRNRLSMTWAMPINNFQWPNTERSQNDHWELLWRTSRTIFTQCNIYLYIAHSVSFSANFNYFRMIWLFFACAQIQSASSFQ